MTTSAPPTAELVRGWVGQLQAAGPVEDAERIEQLRALEELSCAAAGAQARIAYRSLAPPPPGTRPPPWSVIEIKLNELVLVG